MITTFFIMAIICIVCMIALLIALNNNNRLRRTCTDKHIYFQKVAEHKALLVKYDISPELLCMPGHITIDDTRVILNSCNELKMYGYLFDDEFAEFKKITFIKLFNPFLKIPQYTTTEVPDIEKHYHS